ncbi:hypothetical protein WJX84_001580 [Apatococcus fuscideae]|uniref:Uncharacterized protein n=1 Tax=Apatococcus fuscideae TaxID=2026836 RepID=A0AAW1T2K1_9CHLO
MPWACAELAKSRLLWNRFQGSVGDTGGFDCFGSLNFARAACHRQASSRSKFRQHREVSSTEQAAELVEYARDQAELINAVQYQRELLLSYNIGVEQDVTQKKVRERTAARVGLRLPDEQEK